MNPVVHFELPADDHQRANNFYANSFGWQNKNMGADMNNYVTVGTTASDANGRPTTPGAINGGIYTRQPGSPAQHPSLVIAVDDIAAASEKIVANGGKIHGEPYEIPGVGTYVGFQDTEGNNLALLKPLPLSTS
jgi:uncharacterized protein